MISTIIGNSPDETDYKLNFDKLCGPNNKIPSGCAIMAIQFNGGKIFELSEFSFRPETVAFNDTLNNKKVLNIAMMSPPTLLIQVINIISTFLFIFL
jgi:hypothetical protein